MQKQLHIFDVYELWEAYNFQKSLLSKEVLIIAPLHNFNCDKKIVRLDENVSIRHARKNEINNLINKTPIPPYYDALRYELSSIEFVIEEKQQVIRELPYKLEKSSVGYVLLKA